MKWGKPDIFHLLLRKWQQFLFGYKVSTRHLLSWRIRLYYRTYLLQWHLWDNSRINRYATFYVGTNGEVCGCMPENPHSTEIQLKFNYKNSYLLLEPFWLQHFVLCCKCVQCDSFQNALQKAGRRWILTRKRTTRVMRKKSASCAKKLPEDLGRVTGPRAAPAQSSGPSNDV